MNKTLLATLIVALTQSMSLGIEKPSPTQMLYVLAQAQNVAITSDYSYEIPFRESLLLKPTAGVTLSSGEPSFSSFSKEAPDTPIVVEPYWIKILFTRAQSEISDLQAHVRQPKELQSNNKLDPPSSYTT